MGACPHTMTHVQKRSDCPSPQAGEGFESGTQMAKTELFSSLEMATGESQQGRGRKL